MGLNATSDEYCRRGDIAMQGLSGVEKVVDDILVHSPDLRTHTAQVIEVLKRCRQHGITLSPKKFKFGAQRTKYVGYILTPGKKLADPDRCRAIAEFPRPTNLPTLRGFLGLANQLSDFTPALKDYTPPLQQLLQRSRSWQWGQPQEQAFNNIKKLLTALPPLEYYNPEEQLEVWTDASCSNGSGFLLMQVDAQQRRRLLQCGSRTFTDVQKRYAPIEAELLAVVNAVTKCRLFLQGREFTVVTDHKPLIPILNAKTLDDIGSARLLRLREKLAPYSFCATWTAGKGHFAADALSRSPMPRDVEDSDLAELDEDLQENLEFRVNAIDIAPPGDDDALYRDAFRDINIEKLAAAAREDEDYRQLYALVEQGFKGIKRAKDLPESLRTYFGARKDLSVHEDSLVLCRGRIIVPLLERRRMLELLHLPHQGERRTKLRAQFALYWPGMVQDIVSFVGSCPACQEVSLLKPHGEDDIDAPVWYAWQEIAADFCKAADGQTWLVVVDRFSGWIEVVSRRHDFNAADLIAAFRDLFAANGIPRKIRVDGGTQFTSATFSNYLKEKGVLQAITAPYKHNSLAEAAVKTFKRLLEATRSNGDNFSEALLELRCTPGEDGRSPAQKFFGRPFRGLLPKLEVDVPAAPGGPVRKHIKQQFSVGQRVRVQNRITGRWTTYGKVIWRSRQNCQVKLDEGASLWRHQLHLRPLGERVIDTDNKQTERRDSAERDVPKSESPVQQRHSERKRKKPNRLIEQ